MRILLYDSGTTGALEQPRGVGWEEAPKGGQRYTT